MPTIRLGDADRERYGCAEWLDVPQTFPIKDATALESAGGNYMDYFRRDTVRGFQTTVWLALHRAGVAVKLDELGDLDLQAIRVTDAEPGKEQPNSSGGSGRTRRTSATSSTSRRRTSKTSN